MNKKAVTWHTHTTMETQSFVLTLGFWNHVCILLGLCEMSSRDTFVKCFCFTFRSFPCGTDLNFTDSASHLRKVVYTQNPKDITRIENISPLPLLSGIILFQRLIQGLGKDPTTGEAEVFFCEGPGENFSYRRNCHICNCTSNSQILSLSWFYVWSLTWH